MVSPQTKDKLRKMREGDALIRKVRGEVLEWLLAIDELLNAIIAEYFVENEYRKQLFRYEVLTRDFFATRQKIGILADIEIPEGVSIRKHDRTLIRRLERLNSFRNLLVHGFPIALPEGARVWIHRRGQLKPIQINERIFEEMETLYESAFQSLSELYQRLISRTDRGRKRT